MNKIFALLAAFIAVIALVYTLNFSGEEPVQSAEETTVSETSKVAAADIEITTTPETKKKTADVETVTESETKKTVVSDTEKVTTPKTDEQLSFEEGKHFKTLDTEKSAKPTVTEFFSFYCGHCRNFEPFVKQLKASLPDGASFEKSHVAFLGGNMGAPMAKAYATMVVLKQEDALIPAMFKQVQEVRKPPRSEAELRQWFIDQGVDAKKFDATYNSFAIDSMQKRFVKKMQDSELTGVPGIVVNNKYVVLTGEIKTYRDYLDIILYLLKK